MWLRRKTSISLEHARRERERAEIRLRQARQVLDEINAIRRVNHIAEGLEELILSGERT
jgi:hypothetical protein